MYDIKYIFFNKNDETIQGGQKKFQTERQITESITEKH
jgi:hypothetical protein